MAWTTHPDRAAVVPGAGRRAPPADPADARGGELDGAGDVPGWDGNIPAPTFHPSIHFRGSADEGAWHGCIIRGQLYSPP